MMDLSIYYLSEWNSIVGFSIVIVRFPKADMPYETQLFIVTTLNGKASATEKWSLQIWKGCHRGTSHSRLGSACVPDQAPASTEEQKLNSIVG